jgi:hypothetical protein
MAVLLHDFIWCILKRFEACDEDIGEQKEATWSGIMFIRSSEDLFRNDLAKEGPSQVDGLMMSSIRLLSNELCSVYQQTVHYVRVRQVMPGGTSLANGTEGTNSDTT